MYRQDESIYALIPPEEMEAAKQPMYAPPPSHLSLSLSVCHRNSSRQHATTRYAPSVRHAATLMGRCHPPRRRHKSKFQPPKAVTKPYSMMGREVGKPDPQGFMKAGAKTKGQMAQPKPFAREPKVQVDRKAAVPGREEKPIYGLKTSKNYITSNAVENILQAPKRVPTTDPRFTAKEDYGKVPDYLVRIKQERNEEDEFIAHIQQMRAEQTGVKVLPEEVRAERAHRINLSSAALQRTVHFSTRGRRAGRRACRSTCRL